MKRCLHKPQTGLLLATGALFVAAAGLTATLVSTCSKHQYSNQALVKDAGTTPSNYRPKRTARGVLIDDLPLQLHRFCDGIKTQKSDPKDLSRILSLIPQITQGQANVIIDNIGEERLANYFENSPKEIRNDEANNKTLFVVLMDRLISNSPDAGIDTMKRLRPLSLFPGQYSNLLTEAALEPTNSLASRVSNELIPQESWPIIIDGKLFQNLLESGLGIKSAIARLETLPGGKDLAAAAVVRHYLHDDNVVDFETPDGKDLLDYIHSDNMSLYSKALIKKLDNGKKVPIDEQGSEATGSDENPSK